MTVETIDVTKLNTLYRTNKFIISGIENHHDEITSHIIFIHCHLANLLGPAMVQSTNNLRIKPETFCLSMKNVLRHLISLCDLFEYDIPDEGEIEVFMANLDPIIQNDTILILSMMATAALSILHMLYVDRDTVPIWSEYEVPEDIEDSIFRIIVGIKFLGKKQGFTYKDVLEGM